MREQEKNLENGGRAIVNVSRFHLSPSNKIRFHIITVLQALNDIYHFIYTRTHLIIIEHENDFMSFFLS